jgi:hypothetical protein
MNIRSPDIPVQALGQGCPIYEGANYGMNQQTQISSPGTFVLFTFCKFFGGKNL